MRKNTSLLNICESTHVSEIELSDKFIIVFPSIEIDRIVDLLFDTVFECIQYSRICFIVEQIGQKFTLLLHNELPPFCFHKYFEFLGLF